MTILIKRKEKHLRKKHSRRRTRFRTAALMGVETVQNLKYKET